MISVVIPAHNEADEIGRLLEEFSAFEGLELIIAEDASIDHTHDIVQEFATPQQQRHTLKQPSLGR